MSLIDLIDKARELIGGGAVDTLAENAGGLSEIAQGDGSLLEKAQQAVEGLGETGGDAGEAGGDVGDSPGAPTGGSEQR